MKQTSSLTRSLTAAQEQHAAAHRPGGALTAAVVFRLYTEFRPNLEALVNQYFAAATFLDGLGLWNGSTEQAAVIEIIGHASDIQKIFDLAGDIRVTNDQHTVIVTWSDVQRFDLTAATIRTSDLYRDSYQN